MRFGALSLDTTRVDERPVTRRGPITLTLPAPVSAHALFVVSEGYGRQPSHTYSAWKRSAGNELKRQKRVRLSGPVRIAITIGKDTRGNLYDFAKAIIDLLVTHNIIQDDKKDVVREVVMAWGKQDGCVVMIEEAAR